MGKRKNRDNQIHIYENELWFDPSLAFIRKEIKHKIWLEHMGITQEEFNDLIIKEVEENWSSSFKILNYK